jgi:hypothetical protein
MNPLRRMLLILRRLGKSPETSRGLSSSHVSSVAADESDVAAFRFAPELFETRTQVIASLAENGFDWLSHYSSVDPIHETYGIEVCGIRDKSHAISIQQLLIEMFPDWRPG